MMTGVMPSRIGMEANEDQGLTVPESLLEGALGQVFRRAGYRTLYGGKIHLPGPEGTVERVEPYGFDYVCADDRQGLADTVSDLLLQAGSPGDPYLLVASFINPHDICYMAINHVRRAAGGQEPPGPHQEALREALALPSNLPLEEFVRDHCPPLPPNWEPPERELMSSMADKPAFMHHVRETWGETEWRIHRWAYARLTERVDRQIGQVLEALERAGQAENTLIVFASDHGDMDGAHRVEHKAFLYEEAANVPLILSWPGRIPAGRVDGEHLVSVGLDLLPTLCDFAGIPVPTGRFGSSLRPLCSDTPPADWRDHIVVENHLARLVHMGRWKYEVARAEPHAAETCLHCRTYTGAYGSGARELLVDLEADPGEMGDCTADPDCAGVLERGRRLLSEWYAAHGEKLDPLYRV
jgi:choline-sulfatase